MSCLVQNNCVVLQCHVMRSVGSELICMHACLYVFKSPIIYFAHYSDIGKAIKHIKTTKIHSYMAE